MVFEAESQLLRTQKERGLFSLGEMLPPFPMVVEALPARIEAAIRGNLSFFSSDEGSYKGHIDLQAGRYHGFNLAPLVIVPALAHAYMRKLSFVTIGHVTRPIEWLYAKRNVDVDNKMSGLRGDMPSEEDTLWLKYTAEMLQSEVLASRILPLDEAQRYLAYARRHANFIMEAADNGFSPKFDLKKRQWCKQGWHTPGRAIEGLAALRESSADEEERMKLGHYALLYGERLRRLFYEREGLYFRDEEGIPCFDSDMAAPLVRGLIHCYDISQAERYLNLAQEVASWLTERQDVVTGGYPLRIFKDQTSSQSDADRAIANRTEPGSALYAEGITSPGDTANITLSLIELTEKTQDSRFKLNILKAISFCLAVQCTDEKSLAYGLPPSWRNIGDTTEPWRSNDSTYSGDQGGLILRLFLRFSEVASHRPLLYQI